MKPKHLITIQDLNQTEILRLFHVTVGLKRSRGRHQRPLVGKTLGLLFQKPSDVISSFRRFMTKSSMDILPETHSFILVEP